MNEFFDRGENLDKSGSIKEAIKYYEQSILYGENVPESFSNLFMMYWDISFDHGIGTQLVLEKQIEPEDIDFFDKRYREILEKAILQFPQNLEFEFWKAYIDERISYKEHTNANRFRKMMEKQQGFYTPLFYLYSFSENLIGKEIEMIDSYRRYLTKNPTYKNRYVLSYLG